jgi:uncharacterized membrane protein
VRKWLPAIPILVGLGVSASVYGDLPADVRPDWSSLIPFTAGDETMPRLPFAILIPVIAISVWGALAAGARVAGRRGGAFLSDKTGASAIARFEPTFATVVTAVVGLMILLHIALVAGVAGWPEWTKHAVGVVLGLGTAAVGNVIPRVRPNWIVGIRTRATLRDPELWARTHRYFGGLLMLVGVAVAVMSLLTTTLAFVATILGLLVAAVLAYWFAKTRTGNTGAVLAVMLLSLGGTLEAQGPASDPSFVAQGDCPRTREVVLPSW